MGAPSLLLRTTEIPLYDPSNLTIVSASQADWDLAVRVAQRPGIRRLGSACKSYQGEVNETTDRGYLSRDAAAGGRLVLRGSNVCMYTLREASQGVPLYIEGARYRAAKATSGKAGHTLVDRIGFQRSAPQNNFRRVIAAFVPTGEFCFDTVSYIPRASTTTLDLDLLLALLNSKLVDWYFTIGSTNSKVNEYQFNNLPYPVFGRDMTADDKALLQSLRLKFDQGPAAITAAAGRALDDAPFSPAIETFLIDVSRRIRKVEEQRAPISRAARAHLAEGAQPLQDVIDALLFRMVGFSDREVVELNQRLASMA